MEHVMSPLCPVAAHAVACACNGATYRALCRKFLAPPRRAHRTGQAHSHQSDERIDDRHRALSP
jgi:hypothetical protein